MFGLSLPKLLGLGLIIAAIWYGFKWLGRLDRERKARLRESQGGPAPAHGDRQDLVECALCGTYVAAPIAHCPEGRADCPHVEG